MSAASRAREYNRRFRAGFPTWAAFRAWQAAEMARRFPETDATRAQRALDEAQFAAGTPMTYPEPELGTDLVESEEIPLLTAAGEEGRVAA